MKKLLLSMLLVACTSLGHAALTNLPGGLGVGTDAAGTYVALTGAALTYKEIPLASVRQADFITLVADQVITTALYVAVPTTFTQASAVVIPSQIGGTPTFQFVVPDNYLSGGVVQYFVHSSAAVANLVTATASVSVQTPGGADSLVVTAGTAAVWPTTVSYTVQTVSLPCAAAYKPGSIATVKIVHTGADAKKEILGIRFAYKPYGLLP